MRIISGSLKGREIKGYNIDGTRPTMDRVKESLFAMIQTNIKDSVVLDLFAGSGNLGFEALSNGAKYCYFNDHNKICCNYIKENIDKFNLKDNVIITNKDYLEALDYYNKTNIKFDIVFLDPPYKEKINEDIVDYLIMNNILSSNGLIVVEMDNNNYQIADNIKIIKEKKYGDKYILLIKRNS